MKIEVKNGCLVKPQKVEEKGKWRFNKELIKSYTYKKWKIKIENRLIKVEGPNYAEYNLADGVLCLCSCKTDYRDCFYYSIFIDDNNIRLLSRYSVDIMIEEDPNHLYPADAELLTDGIIEKVSHYGTSYKSVKNARCVLEYSRSMADKLSGETLSIIDLRKGILENYNKLRKGKDLESSKRHFYIMRSAETPIIFEKFLEDMNNSGKLHTSV